MDLSENLSAPPGVLRYESDPRLPKRCLIRSDHLDCIQAFFVGFASFAASYWAGSILILFYYTSSKLTKLGQERKRRLDAEYAEGGQRSYVQVSVCFSWLLYGEVVLVKVCIATQVLACSILGTLIAVYITWIERKGTQPPNPYQSWLHCALCCAYVAHYACCTGDTWSVCSRCSFNAVAKQ